MVERRFLQLSSGRIVSYLDEPWLKAFSFNGSDAAVRHLVSRASEKDLKRKRFIAVILVRIGLSIEEVAEVCEKSPDWVEKWVKREYEEYRPDRRFRNGRPMVYRTEFVIEAVSKVLSKRPPDGVRWKDRHVAAYMMANLGYPHVSRQRAGEVRKLAEELSRKKRRVIFPGKSLRRRPNQP